MLYRKNLPGWERGVRVVAALAMATCAAHFGRNPVGTTFAVLAAVAAATAFFGFCPACALAGRRLARNRPDA